jgi:hypothetical protein
MLRVCADQALNAAEEVPEIVALICELCVTCMGSLRQQGQDDEQDTCCAFQMHAAKLGPETHGLVYI